MRSSSFLLVVLFVILSGGVARGADCNRNGFDDTIEIAAGIATDCNGNHIPDDCDTSVVTRWRLPDRMWIQGEHSAITGGDFDEDGLRDLVVLKEELPEALLLLGTPGGGLQSAPEIPLSDVSSRLVVGKLDPDVHLDLAVYSESRDPPAAEVSILRGKGDGSFEAARTIAVAPGARDLLLADFDGNGHTDILTAGGGPRGLSVLLASGDGAFREPLTHPLSAETRDVVIADFDGDGNLDVVLRDERLEAITVLLGKGDGTFQPQRNWTGGVGPLAVSDFDRDGVLDIASAPREREVLLVSHGVGDGTFEEPEELSHPRGARKLIVVDFNGDGIEDLLSTHPGFVAARLSDPEGGVAELQLWHLGRVVDLAVWPWSQGTEIDFAALGNLREANEILLAPQRTAQRLGVGRFRPVEGGDEDSRASFHLLGGDLDGDRRADVVAIDTDERYSVSLIGDGAGGFDIAAEGKAYLPSNPGGIDLTDIDGDTREDLIGAASRGFFVALGRGDGTFEDRVEYSLPSHVGGIVLADFDADGSLDLAASTHSDVNGICVALGRADASFAPADCVPIESEPGRVAADDLNNDGNVDLLAILPASVLVLLGRGDGTFGPGREVDAGLDPYWIETADMDGDGFVDIVLGKRGLARVGILRGLGDGTFESQQLTTIVRRGNLSSLLVEDLDADGYPDVLAGIDDDSFAWLRGSPDDLVHTPERFFATGTPLAIVDVDGDRWMDILSATPGGFIEIRNASGFLGEGDCDRNGVPDSCDLVDGTSADINGNGVPDRCEMDCNGNGSPDSWELEVGSAVDCNGNGVLDACDRRSGLERDCNGNGTLDSCDIANGFSTDFNADGVPDDCQLDCDGNGVPDDADIASDPSLDCNENGSLDSCELAAGAPDCDGDGVLDECAVQPEISLEAGRMSVHRRVGRFAEVIDLGEDAFLDLVTADPTNAYVAFFRGTGKGTFNFVQMFETDEDIESLAVADFDLDGVDDVIYGLRLQGLKLIRGLGDAEFEAPSLVHPGLNSYSLHVEWIDGDSIPDLIVTSPEEPRGQILIGNGDGTFAESIPFELLGGRPPLEPGDYNGDGIVDIAILYDDLNRVVFLHGKGDGTFEAGEPLGAPFTTEDFASLDFNGDGHLDLVVVDRTHEEVCLRAGSASGSYEAPVTLSVPAAIEGIVTTDFDDDGYEDFGVVSNPEGAEDKLYVFLGAPTTSPRLASVVRGVDRGRLLLSADFDADGHQDVLMHRGGYTVVRGTGDGSFFTSRVESFDNQVWRAKVADVDGDSLLDTVASVEGPASGIEIKFGRRPHQKEQSILMPLEERPYDLAVADMDGDGLDDLITATSELGILSVLYNGGDRQFLELRTVPCREAELVRVGDIDEDGAMDLAAWCGDSIVVARTTRARELLSPRQIASSIRKRTLDILDIDGDGHLDLAYLAPNPHEAQIAVRLGDGAGNFGDVRFSSISEEITQVAFGFLGTDEHVDAAVIGRNAEEISLLQGRGDGTFLEPFLAEPQRTRVGDLHLVDMTGDRIDDLVGSSSPIGIVLRSFDAQGRLGDEQLFSARGQRLDQVIDVDRDGDLDLVTTWPDTERERVEIILNETRGSVAGDCNHNGVPDTCDLESGFSQDLNDSGIPDECEPDCNGNAVPDDLEIARGEASDCDQNGRPDSCDVAEYPLLDRDDNGAIDSCETCRIPGNCNGDEVVDVSDAICLLSHLFLGATPDLRCSGEEARTALLDWNPDGILDLTDGVRALVFLFRSGPAHPLAVEGAETTACRPIEGCAAGGG